MAVSSHVANLLILLWYFIFNASRHFCSYKNCWHNYTIIQTSLCVTVLCSVLSHSFHSPKHTKPLLLFVLLLSSDSHFLKNEIKETLCIPAGSLVCPKSRTITLLTMFSLCNLLTTILPWVIMYEHCFHNFPIICFHTSMPLDIFLLFLIY